MNEVVQQLLPYLEKIAEKLGTGAEYVWMCQLQQVKVVLLQVVLSLLFSLALSIALGVVAKKAWDICHKNDGETDEDSLGFGIFLVSGIFFVVSLFGLLNKTTDAIEIIPQLLMNPEYWALQNLLHLVK